MDINLPTYPYPYTWGLAEARKLYEDVVETPVHIFIAGFPDMVITLDNYHHEVTSLDLTLDD